MLKIFKKYRNTKIIIIAILLIFASVSILVISCTKNFQIKQKYILTGEVSSTSAPPAGSEIIIRNLEVKFPGETNMESGDAAGDKMPDETINENSLNNNAVENQGEDSVQDNIDFTSSDSFRIEVKLSEQKVFVFHKDNIIKEMICSAGTEEKPTPRGEFKTTEKGNYFWSDKYNVGAYYWVRFYNEYLFHSVPFDENNKMIEEEYEKLGTPASHGCIRLKPEEAKWLYDMLPPGVKVVIY